MEKQFFTVGELSEMTGVSKQTIRYYDKIGLLKPGKVEENAYRYYEPIHILYLNTIMRLSQLGCSLKETGQFLSGGDLASVNEMLQFRKELTENKIRDLKLSLKALEHQIEMIDLGMQAKNETGVVIKDLPERYFVYEKGFEDLTVKKAIMQINRLVKELGKCGLLYVGNPVFEFTPDQKLSKTGFFLTEKAKPEGFYFETVPPGKYAAVINRGRYDTMPAAVTRLRQHIKASGKNIDLNFYQLFLIDMALTRKEEELVTEIQVKIK